MAERLHKLSEEHHLAQEQHSGVREAMSLVTKAYAEQQRRLGFARQGFARQLAAEKAALAKQSEVRALSAETQLREARTEIAALIRSLESSKKLCANTVASRDELVCENQGLKEELHPVNQRLGNIAALENEVRRLTNEKGELESTLTLERAKFADVRSHETCMREAVRNFMSSEAVTLAAVHHLAAGVHVDLRMALKDLRAYYPFILEEAGVNYVPETTDLSLYHWDPEVNQLVTKSREKLPSAPRLRDPISRPAHVWPIDQWPSDHSRPKSPRGEDDSDAASSSEE